MRQHFSPFAFSSVNLVILFCLTAITSLDLVVFNPQLIFEVEIPSSILSQLAIHLS